MAIQVPSTAPRLLALNEMSLGDMEVLRLCLRGGSVIDWKRLHFQSPEEIDRFLRLCQFEPDDAVDEKRMRAILAEAVLYLRTVFRYRVAEAVAQPERIHDLFLLASGVREPQRLRRIACVVLKVMHVVNHLSGRELLYRTTISEAELGRLVDERVMGCAGQMRGAGFPIVEFVGSVKSRQSHITKLLAKKESLAVQIFDKYRYRITTERREDILPVLNHMTHALFPFAFLLPGQTQNTLFSFKKLVRENSNWAASAKHFQADLGLEAEDRRANRGNEFSGQTYRTLNFIADLPLRLDHKLRELGTLAPTDLGRVTFALVEFQMIDKTAALENEAGDNSHERYKHRQHLRVLRRLARGLVVPKGSKKPQA